MFNKLGVYSLVLLIIYNSEKLIYIIWYNIAYKTILERMIL